MISKFGISFFWCHHFPVNHITLQETITSHLAKSLQKCGMWCVSSQEGRFRGCKPLWSFCFLGEKPRHASTGEGGPLSLHTPGRRDSLIFTSQPWCFFSKDLTQGCRFGPESKPNPGNKYLDPAWYHLWRIVSGNVYGTNLQPCYTPWN